jgi:hypothetical protein
MLRLVPKLPAGVEAVRSIYCGPASRFLERTVPRYAPSPAAVAFRRRRIELGYSGADVSMRLGLPARDLADLEHGRADFADPTDWARLRARLDALGPGAA